MISHRATAGSWSRRKPTHERLGAYWPAREARHAYSRVSCQPTYDFTDLVPPHGFGVGVAPWEWSLYEVGLGWWYRLRYKHAQPSLQPPMTPVQGKST